MQMLSHFEYNFRSDKGLWCKSKHSSLRIFFLMLLTYSYMILQQVIILVSYPRRKSIFKASYHAQINRTVRLNFQRERGGHLRLAEITGSFFFFFFSPEGFSSWVLIKDFTYHGEKKMEPCMTTYSCMTCWNLEYLQTWKWISLWDISKCWIGTKVWGCEQERIVKSLI